MAGAAAALAAAEAAKGFLDKAQYKTGDALSGGPVNSLFGTGDFLVGAKKDSLFGTALWVAGAIVVASILTRSQSKKK